MDKILNFLSTVFAYCLGGMIGIVLFLGLVLSAKLLATMIF